MPTLSLSGQLSICNPDTVVWLRMGHQSTLGLKTGIFEEVVIQALKRFGFYEFRENLRKELPPKQGRETDQKERARISIFVLLQHGQKK